MKNEYEVRNALVEAKLRDIGRRIKASVEEIPGYGFTLMLFSYGEGGDLFYISSSAREDMIKLLDEFKKKLLEQRPKNIETGYKL